MAINKAIFSQKYDHFMDHKSGTRNPDEGPKMTSILGLKNDHFYPKK